MPTSCPIPPQAKSSCLIAPAEISREKQTANSLSEKLLCGFLFAFKQNTAIQSIWWILLSDTFLCKSIIVVYWPKDYLLSLQGCRNKACKAMAPGEYFLEY